MDLSSESDADRSDPSISSSPSNEALPRLVEGTSPTPYRLRPTVSRGDTCGARLEGHPEPFLDDRGSVRSRPSVASLASTIPSSDDLVDGVPEYEVPQEPLDTYWTDALPATSKDFSALFPSSRRLDIKHDDATIDGNMNLRIDTTVRTSQGEERKITLFHLRMHDLRNREFSLRRYCRDSGREVCNTSRKSTKTRSKPLLTRSLSSALTPFRSKADVKPAQVAHLKRTDSGYDSMDSDDEDGHVPQSTKEPQSSHLDTISLEFSNYAHLDIKRKGIKAGKKYVFEYWGNRYSWQRQTDKTRGSTQVSYHLIRRGDQHPIAHIIPAPLTDKEAQEEIEAGGWIPPCCMWISDQSVIDALPDVADAVFSTGIVALVDDSIRRRFHSKDGRQLVIPMPMLSPLHVNLNYAEPKRLISEAFGWHRRTQSSD